MFARKIVQALRPQNGLLIKFNRGSAPSVALINTAPAPAQLSDEEGQVYDPSRESLESFLSLRFGQNFPTINDDKNPQRDLVNFPRPVQPDFPEPTRMAIFPESWFKAFYNKTGVTGPYMFFGTFGTFLLSKEWLVIEHEIFAGIQATIGIAILVKMFGPQARNYLAKDVDQTYQKWDDWQKSMINFLNQFIESEKNIRDASQKRKVLFDAKRENVLLQLEAEFRRRQMQAYNEVKRRLDFLIAKEEAEKQFQQKHMVNWIIDGVAKSITVQQEKDALKTTFSELKKLAANSSL